jgi:hypothetical protein
MVIAIDAMLFVRNPNGHLCSFGGVTAEKPGNGNVFVDRPRRGLANLHHFQNRGGVPAAQSSAWI